MQKVREHLLVMEVEFDVDLIEFGENRKIGSKIVYGSVLKVNDYVFELLFYSSMHTFINSVGCEHYLS